jgi:gluconate 2-dehydrogenase gamma chain
MSDDTYPSASSDGDGGRKISRRRLLQIGAVAGVGTVAGGLAGSQDAAARSEVASVPALRFFTGWEFDYVTAMAETIWPSDDLGPGAKAGGVGYYLDGQLAGSWGQGHRFYLNGPFYTPADTGHGWQIPMTPSQVYRAFLPAYDVYCRSVYGNPYTILAPATQTQALTDLQTNKASIPLAGSTAFGASDFFAMFRQNVLEGMLADPVYGGNMNMVGWKWIGFPGDPMRYGDPYAEYIFTAKPYPHEKKPLPLTPKTASESTTSGAAATGAPPPAASSGKSAMKMSGRKSGGK